MSKDVDPGDSSSLPCPFCACPPFSDFDLFKPHFIQTHLPSYSFAGSWSGEEGMCVTKLVLLIEKYFPYGRRRINILVAECIDCDPLQVKRYKDTKPYRDNYVIACNSFHSPDAHGSDGIGTSVPSPDVITIEDDFDDFSGQVAELQSEISGLSALFKENLETSVASLINISRNLTTHDQFACLFCDRSFPTKIGLGQHKKARHLDEHLLEIEHRFVHRRNHPWDEEELRILFSFEQNLLREGVKFINIELAKLLPP